MENEKHLAQIAEGAEQQANANGEDTLQTSGQLVNASGHVQELDRNFGFWSVFCNGLMTDNAWVAGGGTLVVALYNGGGPGVMWELVLSTLFYVLISAGVAELASAIPSSGSMYHWASVTGGPRYGRVLSFYAGWWSFFAYLFGTASAFIALGNAIVAMYALYHPDYTLERWHVFIPYLAMTWASCSIILFSQNYVARVSMLCASVCAIAWLVTVLTCAIMPARTGYGYASNSFVWTDWNNQTGWSSNGFVFLAGLLNGAYTIGTPDIVCHLAEEVGQPRRNLPRGIFAQLAFGFVTTFIYYLTLLYAITSFSDVTSSPIQSLPLAAIYQQATRSNAGTVGLLAVFVFCVSLTSSGCYVTTGRMLWTLGRDNATPFGMWIGKVSERWKNPFNATFVAGCGVTILGVVYVGSLTAFNAIVGGFVIFTTLSYLAAILPHILSRRRYVKPGSFWMQPPLAYSVMGVACAYIIVSNVIFCFPFSMPATAPTMNYASLMTGGITLILTFLYLWKRNHGYRGPVVIQDASDDVMEGHVLTGADLEKDRAGEMAKEKSPTVTSFGEVEAV